jgi:hypothetical protein
MSSETEKVRCLGDAPAVGDLAWGGEGDRVLIDAAQTHLRSKEFTALLGADQQASSWSRPTGTSVISVTGAGRLVKTPASGDGAPADISFLARHDEAVYHPSGTHIVSTGKGAGGYGIYIANNEGGNQQQLAVSEAARRVYDLAMSHDGKTLFYAAEHRQRFDLHSLSLKELSKGAGTTGRLRRLFTGDDEITDIHVSEFSTEPLIAFRSGCRAYVDSEEGETAILEDEGFSRPVGWLPDATLVVILSGNECDGPGDLYAYTNGGATLLVEDVDAAAIRAVLPPPPDPPVVSTEVVA